MKQKSFEEPSCGFPDGFHEFDSLPDMPEDDCCIHCGRPRHEIESSQQVVEGGRANAELKCKHVYHWQGDFCVKCGRGRRTPNKPFKQSAEGLC